MTTKEKMLEFIKYGDQEAFEEFALSWIEPTALYDTLENIITNTNEEQLKDMLEDAKNLQGEFFKDL